MSSEQSKNEFPPFSLSGVRVVQTDFAVTTSVKRIMKNDPKRKSLVISNTSASEVYIKPQNNVSATLGIRVQANGGYYELKREDWFNLVTGEWFVIGAGAVTILLLELVEY
jgi:hypothetical protein